MTENWLKPDVWFWKV